MPGSSYIAITKRLHRRAAFTLVEMLAVMAIIVLLLAATLPALRGLNQSESRRGAVGNTMAALDRARMMAITDGLATYVVFACPSDPTQINDDLRGRAFAIYEDSDNVSFIPTQKTPWLQLPKGMAFKVKADVVNDCISARFASQAPTSDTSFPIATAARPPGSAATSLQLPYWKFDATGAVSEQTYLRLLIFPGSVDPSGQEISTQNTAGGQGNKASSQLEEIDLNQATGRAKYIIDPTNNLQSTPSPTPAS